MSGCLMIGAAMLSLAVPEFTLSWTHSVEKTGWVETWQIRDDGLHLTRAAVKGSGAGMDPADDARLEGGWWVWNPENTVVPGLTLAASGATGAGWQICSAGDCREIGATAGAALSLRPCAQ
jgi:hypothetical protein